MESNFIMHPGRYSSFASHNLKELREEIHIRLNITPVDKKMF